MADGGECKPNKSFTKHINFATNATNVLIGYISDLSEDITLLIRFEEPVMLEHLSEVLLPTKFLFILLGPLENLNRYQQIGKSAITLFSDEVNVGNFLLYRVNSVKVTFAKNLHKNLIFNQLFTSDIKFLTRRTERKEIF